MFSTNAPREIGNLLEAIYSRRLIDWHTYAVAKMYQRKATANETAKLVRRRCFELIGAPLENLVFTATMKYMRVTLKRPDTGPYVHALERLSEHATEVNDV